MTGDKQMTLALDKIRESICSGYGFDEIDSNSYLVHTNMFFDDGDELHIVLKDLGDSLFLTDEGHTMMWLSYEDFNFTESRTRLLDGILGQNCVTMDEGRICVSVDRFEDVGSALSSLVQAILQTASLRYLSRNNVASSFIEDIITTFNESDIRELCEFHKKIEVSQGFVEPDVYIESSKPILIFGASNSERAKEAIINLFLAKEIVFEHITVVIIDSDAGISQKDQNRLINTADRPIMGKEGIIEMTKHLINA